jgi:uncharacterized repeat protein (TIGR02543 family)
LLVIRKMKNILSLEIRHRKAPNSGRGLAAAGLCLLLAGGARGGVFTNLFSFENGSFPAAGLVSTADGNLYGTTQNGGTNNLGTVFRISTNGAFASLYSFTGGTDGANPYAALTLGRDGELYGTTLNGGSSHVGTIFKITTGGVLTPLHSFSGGNDGGNPFGALVQAGNGELYGTASAGGANSYGAIFAITTNGAFTALHEFTGGSDGAYPYAGLVLRFDGYLYGTAAEGGANAAVGMNYGTVFQISPGGTLVPIYSFTGTDGAFPYAALAQGSDGNLYGTTAGVAPAGGGTLNDGTVFSVTPGGVFTLYSFTGGSDGANPYGGLVQASDGNLYGTTTGNTTNTGSLFSITTAGALTPLVDFNGGNGGNPYGSLVQGVDGNLYGTTSAGGASAGGTVFQYSLTAPPFVITQPASQTINNHTTATFGVLAGGSGTLAYRWLKNGTNLFDGGNIAGSATSTLSVSNVSSAEVGAYAVVVSSPYGEVTSSNAYLTVVVVKPTLSILHPTQNAHLSNAVLTVTGKTKGKVPVASVFYQLNGTGWNLAQSTNVWTNWSASVTVPPGTNLLQAYAVDESGNVSSTNNVKFRYVLSAPVTVLTNGFGTVSPKDNGHLLAIGQSYTLNARPGRGFAFHGWTGSVTNSSSKLTFVMASNLTFTANFVDVARPVLAILTPKTRQHWSNAVFTATGKASDNIAVASVFYQLDGAGWNPAQTANGWTNWTASLALTPGTNIFQAYAVDNSGNLSLTNTVQLLYVPSSSRRVREKGLGTAPLNDGAAQNFACTQFYRIEPVLAGASAR